MFGFDFVISFRNILILARMWLCLYGVCFFISLSVGQIFDTLGWY